MRNGHIKRITDQDIQSSVLEIVGTNVSTTFITCPADAGKTLGIKLPFLVMILKNLKKYFTFEVQVLDDKNVRRRFRASNYQSTTRVKPFICTMPMRLDEVFVLPPAAWNAAVAPLKFPGPQAKAGHSSFGIEGAAGLLGTHPLQPRAYETLSAIPLCCSCRSIDDVPRKPVPKTAVVDLPRLCRSGVRYLHGPRRFVRACLAVSEPVVLLSANPQISAPLRILPGVVSLLTSPHKK